MPAKAPSDVPIADSAEAQPADAASEDTSWQERYKGKLVLGFKPEPGYKAVALTFDDGPNGQTQYILKTLAEYDGQGTFFDSGRKLEPKWARHPGADDREGRLGDRKPHAEPYGQ